MSETATQPRPSPAHRRQGRNNGRGAAQKAYASENDVAAMASAKQHHSNNNNNHHHPQTPRKNNHHQDAQGNNSAKQRTQHNKSARNKNAATSGHETDQPSHHMTPQRQKSSTKTPNSIAFAGSTFHSSPAPDAIPMPSFLSKPSNSPLAKQTTQQPTPPASSRDGNLTENRPSLAPSTSDSPLNFMFEAHRREKEREKSGSHPGATSAEIHPSYSGHANGQAARPSPIRHHSNGAIDGDELGDQHSQPPGPAFATPFGERMRAARPAPGHGEFASPSPRQYAQYHSPQQPYHHQPAPHASVGNNDDPTEALKKMLFGGAKQQPSASPSAPQPNRPTLSELGASSHRPSQPSFSNGMDLHERIRQELRLDGPSQSPNAQRRLFSQ